MSQSDITPKTGLDGRSVGRCRRRYRLGDSVHDSPILIVISRFPLDRCTMLEWMEVRFFLSFFKELRLGRALDSPVSWAFNSGVPSDPPASAAPVLQKH